MITTEARGEVRKNLECSLQGWSAHSYIDRRARRVRRHADGIDELSAKIVRRHQHLEDLAVERPFVPGVGGNEGTKVKVEVTHYRNRPSPVARTRPQPTQFVAPSLPKTAPNCSWMTRVKAIHTEQQHASASRQSTTPHVT